MKHSKDEILYLINEFRNAIVISLSYREFHYRDRMSHFPNGCCDDACDLLAFYLWHEHDIQTVQFNGEFFDYENPENTTNHNWLEYDGYIIDITYSQFSFITNSQDKVYFGSPNDFYMSLERVQQAEHCDIRNNERLWNDYQRILEHLR